MNWRLVHEPCQSAKPLRIDDTRRDRTRLWLRWSLKCASDQGVQFPATAYTDILAGRGVAISMAAIGKLEEKARLARAGMSLEISNAII
jgi:hypothetical protein